MEPLRRLQKERSRGGVLYLEHYLVVGRRGTAHPQSKLAGVSLHVLRHPQL